MNHRGRPKKSGPRESSGKVQRNAHRDHGTPEYQIMRLQLAQGADPAKTSCPLDLLHVRGVISLDMLSAGVRFARAYKAVHRVHPQAVDADRSSKGTGEASPEELKRLVKLEARLGKVIKTLSRQCYTQVFNICVMERQNFPIPAITAKHRNRQQRLTDGLRALIVGG